MKPSADIDLPSTWKRGAVSRPVLRHLLAWPNLRNRLPRLGRHILHHRAVSLAQHAACDQPSHPAAHVACGGDDSACSAPEGFVTVGYRRGLWLPTTDLFQLIFFGQGKRTQMGQRVAPGVAPHPLVVGHFRG